MNLLFIKDESEIDEFKNNYDLNSSDNIIIPLMPKVKLALYELSIKDAGLPISFLSKLEQEQINIQSIDLSKKWYLPLKEKLQYKNVDLIDCCRLMILSFFQDIIAAELSISKIIEMYKADNAVFFKKPSIPSIEYSSFDGTADTGEAVFQWRLKESGINLIILESIKKEEDKVQPIELKSSKKSIIKKIKNKMILFFNKIKENEKKIVIIEEQREIDPHRLKWTDIPKDKPLLIGCGGGYDVLIIWPYLKQFAKEINGYPLIIMGTEYFDVKTLRSGLKLDEELKFLYINDIPLNVEEQPDLLEIKKTLIDFINNKKEIDTVLQNPLLLFQIDLIFNTLLPQVINNISLAFCFFKNHKTKLYLDDYGNGNINRAWVETAKIFNIDTVAILHGATNLLEFQDFNAKWIFAWGKLGKINLDLANPDKTDHILISGDPSMENLIENVPEKKEEKNKILLLTGGFLHQVWTDFDFNKFINTWNDILKIVIKKPDIEFIIKPHPSVRDLGYWYRKFVLKSKIQNLKVVDNCKLEELLPSSFLAILMGKPGTAGFVCSLYDVPFIYYDSMLCRDVKGYDIWCDKNGVPKIYNCDEFDMLIEKFKINKLESERIIKENNKFKGLYYESFNANYIVTKMGLK